jgi:hypothetical protein
MRPANIPTGAARVVETGLVWRELATGASITVELDPFTIFRVHALAGLTVTIDGLLAMTMVAGEVERFNTGDGSLTDTKRTVTVAISASCNMQVGLETSRRN